MDCRRYGGSMIGQIRRRMMMGGDAEAYDAEVDFIESHGSQYIDTEYIGTGYDRFDVQVALTNLSNSSGNFAYRSDVFGANADNANHVHALEFLRETSINWNAVWLYNKYNVVQFTYLSPTTFTDAQLLNFHIIKGKLNDIYIDNVLNHPTINAAPSPNLIYSYFLFATNRAGNPHYATSYLRIRYFKLWDRNDNLVRDMIPVRVGVTGYMYDRVTQKMFGNQGAGQFIIGPDKTT